MCIALGCKKLKAQTEMGVWHRFRRNSAFEFEEFELRVRRVQVSSSKILSFGLESQTLISYHDVQPHISVCLCLVSMKL